MMFTTAKGWCTDQTPQEQLANNLGVNPTNIAVVEDIDTTLQPATDPLASMTQTRLGASQRLGAASTFTPNQSYIDAINNVYQLFTFTDAPTLETLYNGFKNARTQADFTDIFNSLEGKVSLTQNPPPPTAAVASVTLNNIQNGLSSSSSAYYAANAAMKAANYVSYFPTYGDTGTSAFDAVYSAVITTGSTSHMNAYDTNTSYSNPFINPAAAAIAVAKHFTNLAVASSDTSPPTVTVTSNKVNLKKNETAILTFTFSDPTTSFDINKIAAPVGTLSNFSGSGINYTATFTPTDNIDNGLANINTIAGFFSDAAGNSVLASNTLTLPYDTKSPTVSIAAVPPTLKKGQTSNVTFTFSELLASTPNATTLYITGTGGTLGALIIDPSNPLKYTATFTPTDGINNGSANIQHLVNWFQDKAGNYNTGSNSLAYPITYDTKSPTVTVTVTPNTYRLKKNETATLSFLFSEAPKNFDMSKRSYTGGTLSDLIGAGTIYTATFTPNPNTNDGSASIQYLANWFQDQAGNYNADPYNLTLTYDTLSPTVSIAAVPPTLKKGQTSNVTFTFSDAPGSFDLSNINYDPTKGALEALTKDPNNPLKYTATFTPTDGLNGGSASIATNPAFFSDAAGNAVLAGALASPITYDTLSPTLVSVISDKAKLKRNETATLTFMFSEALASTPDARTLTVTGTTVGTLGALTKDSSDPLKYTATFTPTDGLNGGSATIQHLVNWFQDQAGNYNVDTHTLTLPYDTLSPTLVSVISDKAKLKKNETATLSFLFSEALASTPDVSKLIVTPTTSGTLGALTPNANNSLLYTAIFTPTDNTNGGSAAIQYLANWFQDQAGNYNTSGNTLLSLTYDTKSPTVSIAASTSQLKKNETATLTFTFSEELASTPDANTLSITGTGGTLGALIQDTIDPLKYTATFTPTDGINNGSATIQHLVNWFQDKAGNYNTGSNTLASPITYDTLSPTLVSVICDKMALKKNETATLNFLFSEPLALTPDASTLRVTGGTLGALTPNGNNPLLYTAIFTPTDNTNGGSATIQYLTNWFKDQAGNYNTSGNTLLSLTYDTLSPTVSIAASTSQLKKGQTSNITFTFSDAPGSFDINKIIATGGTLGPIIQDSSNPLKYTATFTPKDNINNGSATINTVAGFFTDAAGNPVLAGTLASPITYDTLSPTVTIAAVPPTLNKGQTSNVTFIFSDSPGSFDLSNINYDSTKGALEALTKDPNNPLKYTATFTPNPDVNYESVTINTIKEFFNDTSGNLVLESDALTLTYDTLSPFVSIEAAPTKLKKGQTSNITFTFSDAPGSFDLSNINYDPTKGALGALTKDPNNPLKYTATFTPIDGFNNGSVSIATLPGFFTDTAGNPVLAGTLTLTYDTLSPTVSIAASTSQLRKNETATLTFTFSEELASTPDANTLSITGTGGTLGALIQDNSNSLKYTATFTPTDGINNGSATIQHLVNWFQDQGGNYNTGSNTLASPITYDTLSPTLVSVICDKMALKKNETATLNFLFSEPLASTPDASTLTVTGGTLGALTPNGNNPLLYTAIFTPTDNTNNGSATIQNVLNWFQDQAGNGNTDTNPLLSLTYDTQCPTVSIAASTSQLRKNETATLTFTFSEELASTPDANTLSITGTGGGTLGALTQDTIDPLKYTAIFTPTNGFKNGSASIQNLVNWFQDQAGNYNTDTHNLSFTYDTLSSYVSITAAPPTLKKNETSKITFTFSDTPTKTFDTSIITIKGGTLSNLMGSDTIYTATFTPKDNINNGSASITTRAAFFSPTANNPVLAGALDSPITYDTKSPFVNVNVNPNKTTLKKNQTATLTFTFSEELASTPDVNALTVTGTGGTLGTLTKDPSNSLKYTAIFTPTDNINDGSAAIQNVVNWFQDQAGNGNTDTNSLLSLTYDTLSPTVTVTSDKATLKKNEKATLTFLFSELLTLTPKANKLTVTGGTLGNLTKDLSNSLKYTALFTPIPNINSGSATIQNVVNWFQDKAGNYNTDSDNLLSLTYDTLSPTVTVISDKATLKKNETAILTFTFSEELASTPDVNALTVTGTGGTLGALNQDPSNSLKYTATFTPKDGLKNGLAIIKNSVNWFQDEDGNYNNMDPRTLNLITITYDTLSPTL